MSRLAIRLGAISFVALVGCTSTEGNNESQDHLSPMGPLEVHTPAPKLPPTFYPAYSSGFRAFEDTFDLKEEVYLSVHGGNKTTEGDYYFHVVDPNNVSVSISTDDVACRRIHINSTGIIDAVYNANATSGVPCAHRTGLDTVSIDGGLTVQLLPYGDATLSTTNLDGSRKFHYMVELTPVATYEGKLPLDAQGQFFGIYVPQGPVCGDGHVDDGEACDDGNRADHDGCSATCTVELCGNGVLDEGEECDDGNRIDLDGCSPLCTCEPM